MSAGSDRRPTPPLRRPPRFQHRQLNHESAHSEMDEAAATIRPVDLPLVPAGPAPLVCTKDELISLVARLRQAGSFAYDSEFIGELTYVPKLCLIQVASAQEVALIDPLADLDLTPFWELICDPSVEKTVHAGEQDIEPVFRHVHGAPANLFDTQIAAGFIGLPYPLALSKLVGELVHVRLGKGLTFTHWDKRPLTVQQLRYAADDVRYLPAVRAELGRRLDAAGHAAWAKEESAGLCDESLYQFDASTAYMRIRGATSLPPVGLGILREVTAWRDAVAQAEDLPPRSLIRDEVLLELARHPVRDLASLSRIRGLPRPVEARFGPDIVAAIAKARSLPPAELPVIKHYEPSPPEKFKSDALWSMTECLCFGRGIDPTLVTSRQEIGTLIRHHTTGHAEPTADVPRLLTGWRRQAIGEDLLQILEGKSALTIRHDEGSFQANTNAR